MQHPHWPISTALQDAECAFDVPVRTEQEKHGVHRNEIQITGHRIFNIRKSGFAVEKCWIIACFVSKIIHISQNNYCFFLNNVVY